MQMRYAMLFDVESSPFPALIMNVQIGKAARCAGWGGQKRNQMIAQAAEKVVDQEASLGPKGAEEAEAVRAVVAALMHELECILHEYLSFNWDRAEDIYDANKKMLHSGDLPSLWKSTPMLSVSLLL